MYFAKFISYQDKYFYDIKNLEIVDKTKNIFLIFSVLFKIKYIQINVLVFVHID